MVYSKIEYWVAKLGCPPYIFKNPCGQRSRVKALALSTDGTGSIPATVK